MVGFVIKFRNKFRLPSWNIIHLFFFKNLLVPDKVCYSNVSETMLVTELTLKADAYLKNEGYGNKFKSITNNFCQIDVAMEVSIYVSDRC